MKIRIYQDEIQRIQKRFDACTCPYQCASCDEGNYKKEAEFLLKAFKHDLLRAITDEACVALNKANFLLVEAESILQRVSDHCGADRCWGAVIADEGLEKLRAAK